MHVENTVIQRALATHINKIAIHNHHKHNSSSNNNTNKQTNNTTQHNTTQHNTTQHTKKIQINNTNKYKETTQTLRPNLMRFCTLFSCRLSQFVATASEEEGGGKVGRGRWNTNGDNHVAKSINVCMPGTGFNTSFCFKCDSIVCSIVSLWIATSSSCSFQCGMPSPVKFGSFDWGIFRDSGNWLASSKSNITGTTCSDRMCWKAWRKLGPSHSLNTSMPIRSLLTFVAIACCVWCCGEKNNGRRECVCVCVCVDGSYLHLTQTHIHYIHITPTHTTHNTNTYNAMFYNLHDKHIEDYVGGMKDLAARLLRTPMQASKTLLDDPLRLLRALRFCSTLGFTIHSDILEAGKSPAVLVRWNHNIVAYFVCICVCVVYVLCMCCVCVVCVVCVVYDVYDMYDMYDMYDVLKICCVYL